MPSLSVKVKLTFADYYNEGVAIFNAANKGTNTVSHYDTALAQVMKAKQVATNAEDAQSAANMISLCNAHSKFFQARACVSLSEHESSKQYFKDAIQLYIALTVNKTLSIDLKNLCRNRIKECHSNIWVISYNSAVEHYNERRYEQAVTHFNEAIKHKDDDIDSRRLASISLFRLKRYPDALNEIKVILDYLAEHNEIPKILTLEMLIQQADIFDARKESESARRSYLAAASLVNQITLKKEPRLTVNTKLN